MRIKQFFSENLLFKISSLLLAIFLELYFYGPDNSVISTITVPVEFINLPPQTMIVEPRGAERGLYADVVLSGPRPLVEQVKNKNNRFVFDLATYETANPVVFLTPEKLSLTAGVKAEISPDRIKLGLERVLRKEVAVKPVHTGAVAEGYMLDDIVVTPRHVVADGPKPDLTGVQFVETQAIDITGLRENKSFEVALENTSLHTRYSVNTVEVSFVITPVQSRKELSDVHVKVLAPPGYAATVQPSRVTAIITGPEATLSQVERAQVELLADSHLLEAGKHIVPISAQLPSGVKLIRTDPETVTVTLVTSNG